MSHGLPNPPPEPAVDTSLDELAPKFRASVTAMLEEFTDKGYDPKIAEAFRTANRQAWLYGFGRDYDDGRGVVTQAESNETTWHGYGLAVDIISRAEEWNAPNAFWVTLGILARNHGLVWGGDWARFQDRPHVQFGPPMRQSPSQHAADLLASGGPPAVWAEVGAS